MVNGQPLKSESLPKVGSKSLKSFILSWKDINRLFNFILFNTAHIDHTAEIAFKALFYIEDDIEKKKLMEDNWKERKGAVDELKANRQLLLEVILVRHLENYLNYLSSLLFEIFQACPSALKTSEKIEIEKVLEHDSIDSFIKNIAEQKVDSLSYSSLSKVSEYYKTKFGLSIGSESELEMLSKNIEIRNISVHNRCMINKRYIIRTNTDMNEIGKKKELFISDLDLVVPKLLSVSISVDKQARNKMKIKTIRFGKI